MHNYHDLITLFKASFFEKYNTCLVKGGAEPIYLPADEHNPHHRIVFANGFYSSALHEISHWLIAGRQRRLLIDYGYWYEPDGRNTEQQLLFETVEAKPQALEWILSTAAGYSFQFSFDNLNGSLLDTKRFKSRVLEQVNVYAKAGLPKRAQIFYTSLCKFYEMSAIINIAKFKF